MRERTKSEKVMVVLFFAGVGLLLGYLVYTLATFNMDFDKWRASYKSRWAKQIEAEAKDPFLLRKNIRKTVGRVDITYRGIESGAIVIDFIVLDLDPEYSYAGRIPIIVAKRGFLMGEEQYRLVSAGMHSMRIEPVEKWDQDL